ncbi:MAG: DegT/DnrJ/EryC1/StrS family aminotransferase [Caldilineaceae bacterium]
MFRHLPPTATPLPLTTLLRAWPAGTAATEQFRTALQAYLGVPRCDLAASGRTALYLLLRALQATADHPDRRAVVLPAYTCPAVAKVVLDVGLQPYLVDIIPTTLAFDLDRLAAAVSEQTLAVIHVHPFGMPLDLAPVQSLAQAAGAVVIEDAAQALGAKVGGRPVGTVGEYGLFSLGPGKALSTGGGGILSANTPAALQRLTQGQSTWPPLPASGATPALLRLALFTLAFQPPLWWLATRLGAQRVGKHEASWGYRLRGLTPMQAAVGLAQLPRLDAYNQHRRQTAQLLDAELQGIAGVQLFSCSGGGVQGNEDDKCNEPIYLRFPLSVHDQARREQLFQRLWAAGIGVGRMYQRTLAEIFPQLAVGHYPGAQVVAQGLLTLPTHHFVTEQDVVRIGQIFSAGKSQS